VLSLPVSTFAPLHCLPTPRPYLSPILHTPANQSPALALLYSVLCNLSCHAPTYFGINLCTFAQAVGRFAPLHCLPTPRPYLSPILHTPANQSPALALLYSVLDSALYPLISIHLVPSRPSAAFTFPPLHRSSAPIYTFALPLLLSVFTFLLAADVLPPTRAPAHPSSGHKSMAREWPLT